MTDEQSRNMSDGLKLWLLKFHRYDTSTLSYILEFYLYSISNLAGPRYIGTIIIG